MSKRRNIGDRVWVIPGAGFGRSKGEWATIPDVPGNQMDELNPCFLFCGDDDCVEWTDVCSEDRPDVAFYHVSECEMFDGPQ